jgi:hypothetical protein
MTRPKNNRKIEENSSVDSSTLLFSNIAALLSGHTTAELKLHGTPEQIEALNEAFTATQGFQDELYSSSASLDSIVEALRAKHAAAAKFEKLLGVSWAL